MKQFLSLLLISSFSVYSYAGTKACYCETGNYPSEQVGFFQTGCTLWLNSQKNCSTKATVPQGTDYMQIQTARSTTSLSIGYVGHWSSVYETISYIKTYVLPLMSQKKMSVSIDNTACRSMSNPEAMLDFVKSLKLSDSSLEVRGNQAISVGKWDIFGKSLNFTAAVSSKKSEVIYPSCRSYEDSPCLAQFQMGESGKCLNINKKVQTLTCCEVQDYNSDTGAADTKYLWSKPESCAKPGY